MIVCEDYAVRCPVCNFEYTHIIGIRKVDGNDNYEANPLWRGDLYALSFECENDHCFEIHYTQHKGMVIREFDTPSET